MVPSQQTTTQLSGRSSSRWRKRTNGTVAQLLLECKKGKELVQAIRNLYRKHEFHWEMKMAYLRFDGASWRNLWDMELGYDSRGPSPMFSTTPSSTAPLLLPMPLPMYVSPTNFYWMNSHRCPSSVPLPIPMFFGSYSSLGIALPLLPTLSCLVSPVRSIAHL